LSLPKFGLNIRFAQLYYPEGLAASDIIPRFAKRNVIVAGGLHTEIKGPLAEPFSFVSVLFNSSVCIDKYFRIGHMGITAVNEKRGDIDTIVRALEEVVTEARAAKQA
jgi:alanine-glyoxylate transaminase/serine-glyoxylate transaminase/serine-pyruvate transaminase